MQEKQDAQYNQTARGAQVRTFRPQQKVLVQIYRGGEGEKWLPRTIIRVLGPVTYLVDVNGKVCKRHVNQMLQA